MTKARALFKRADHVLQVFQRKKLLGRCGWLHGSMTYIWIAFPWTPKQKAYNGLYTCSTCTSFELFQQIVVWSTVVPSYTREKCLVAGQCTTHMCSKAAQRKNRFILQNIWLTSRNYSEWGKKVKGEPAKLRKAEQGCQQQQATSFHWGGPAQCKRKHAKKSESACVCVRACVRVRFCIILCSCSVV